MLTTSKQVLLATAALAALTASGCSNLMPSTANSVRHRQVEQQKALLQKVALHRDAGNAAPQAQNAKAALDEDFDTWERLFQGFQIPPAYSQHPSVQQFVRYYGRNPQQLSLLSERASVFLHMIVHEVERRGMPSEIALLPFVESAFDPDVFSHAGAAGLWQFIPDTGRRYGLSQARDYDARMDPFAATGAALSYLQELHAQFNGDWLLALAAYNCGEKRVAREIERNRAQGLPTTFWHLALPRETREYVPRLLAFKELISNAPRYGIKLADTPNTAKLAQLRIDKPVDLRQAALAAGLATDALTSLNACFRQGITTPKYSNRIVLPRSHAEQLASIIEALPPARITNTYARTYARTKTLAYNRLATTSLGKKGPRMYTVRSGDTLRSIAQKHGTSVQALLKENGKRGKTLQVGERISIS
ncbi:MAG: transglycosylase SLT domain-containing protein [Thiothrix sp.]